MAEREAQDEFEAAHVAQEFLHARRFPATLALALGEPQRSLPPVLVVRWGAPGGATPDEGPGTRFHRRGDEILMLALERRVRDLKDLEYAHGNVVGQVREGPRHPDEADLPIVAEREQRLDRAVGLHLLTAR